jgi:ABC-2 type transport system permease protein
MTVFATLLRKHLLEARWLLGSSCAAFCALAVLTTWIATRFERVIDEGQINERRYGFLRGLGGPAQDFSTTGLEVCWWNHPVIVLTVLSWAVARGAAAIAGEIERGTVDVTLSRPVSRSSYLTSHIVFSVLGLAAMAGSLIVGVMAGNLYYPVKSAPSVLMLLRPATMLLTLGMAVFGYTLPFSSLDVVRWRPTLVSAAVTLGGLIALSVANQFPDYENVLKRLSVFQAYAPVTTALKGDPLAYNASILLVVFAIGSAVSYGLFLRRDIPSNS